MVQGYQSADSRYHGLIESGAYCSSEREYQQPANDEDGRRPLKPRERFKERFKLLAHCSRWPRRANKCFEVCRGNFQPQTAQPAKLKAQLSPEVSGGLSDEAFNFL
jgi:hypothetical protein